MSFYIMGPLFGPILGPMTGGYVTEKLNYNWIFYITSVISGLAGLYAIFLPLRETYHPLLREQLIAKSQALPGGLERERGSGKAIKALEPEEEKSDASAQEDPESGIARYRVKYEREPGQRVMTTREVILVNMSRPFALFFRSFILFILALFMAM